MAACARRRRGKGVRRRVGARGDSDKDDGDCDMHMGLARMCEVQIGKIIITTMAIMMVTSTPTEKLTSPWEIADQCQCGPDTARIETGSKGIEGDDGE